MNPSLWLEITELSHILSEWRYSRHVKYGTSFAQYCEDMVRQATGHGRRPRTRGQREEARVTDYSVGKYLGELADLARPLLRTLWTDVLAPSRLRERRRRQYACAALTGQMVAQPSHLDPKDSFQEAGTDHVLTRAQIVARRAFMYADAMIDEEEREP